MVRKDEELTDNLSSRVLLNGAQCKVRSASDFVEFDFRPPIGKWIALIGATVGLMLFKVVDQHFFGMMFFAALTSRACAYLFNWNKIRFHPSRNVFELDRRTLWSRQQASGSFKGIFKLEMQKLPGRWSRSPRYELRLLSEQYRVNSRVTSAVGLEGALKLQEQLSSLLRLDPMRLPQQRFASGQED